MSYIFEDSAGLTSIDTAKAALSLAQLAENDMTVKGW